MSEYYVPDSLEEERALIDSIPVDDDFEDAEREGLEVIAAVEVYRKSRGVLFPWTCLALRRCFQNDDHYKTFLSMLSSNPDIGLRIADEQSWWWRLRRAWRLRHLDLLTVSS